MGGLYFLKLRRFSSIRAISIISVFFAISCTSQKPVLPSPSSVSFQNVTVTPLNQHDVRVDGTITVSNPDASRVLVKSGILRFSSGDSILAEKKVSFPLPKTISNSIDIPFSHIVNLDAFLASGTVPPDVSTQPYDIKTEMETVTDGYPFSVAAEIKGVFPVVREPSLVITAIKIGRDILVTTKLYLSIEITNPNAFPVTFRDILYDFYGEGRLWTTGTTEDTYAVPALETISIILPVEMNFTSMGRNVFDLVATLKTVDFRLSGESVILTGLPALPEFRMSFALAGTSEVVR